MRPTRVVVGVVLAACGVAALSGVAVTRVLSSSPKDTLPSDKAAALQTVSGVTLPSGKAAALEKVFGAPQGNVPTMRGTSGLPMPGLLKHWEIRPRPLDALIEYSKPFPSSIYLLEAKVWVHWHANKLVNVYAGAFTHDQQHGFVIVQTRPYPLRVSLVPNPQSLSRPDNVTEYLYRTPTAVGSVKIVAWHGMVLTLVPTSGGPSLKFDVSRLRFTTLGG